MFIKVRRTLIALALVAASSMAAKVAYATDSSGSTPCVAGVPTSTSALVSFDSTFASDGAYDFSGQLASSSYTGAAAGPNGSLYVAASEGTEYSLTPTNSLTRVYRFLANGTLDSTWGNSGVASIDISASATNSERPSDVLVLSDGSVVVGIRSTTFGSSMTVELKLAKLTSAGALDATFGTNGLASIASGSSSVMLRTFVEGPARTIYVGKSTMTGNYPNMVTTYGVIKLSALGVVDSAFGTNGELATSSDVMATDSTGALYVGGLTSSTPADAKVVKYLPSGSIDTSFGASGEKVLSTSSGSGAESLSALVVANGKLSGVVGARGAIVNNFPTYETSLFRMNTSGVLDASFGSGGIALLGTVGNSIRDITVLSDGSAILPVLIFASGGPPSWGFTAMTADGTPVASLVTSLADLKSGTCKLSDAAVVVTSAGLFVAGLAFPAGEGSPTTHIFKIALADFATGGSNTGGGSNVDTPSTPATPAADTPSTPATPAAVPTLVTSSNAAALVRMPGSESIIVNGEEVVIESKTVSIAASRTPESQRTPAQVASIQQAGAVLLQQFLASLPAGATSNVTVVNTSTGAVMQNLVFDGNGNSVNVPVEDIVFLDGPQLSLMIGSNNANITADGKYQVGAGGIVGVTGSGLGAGASGEVVAMSTPTLLATFQTTAAGDFNKSATLPESIGVGDHTLVVAAGTTYAMMGIRVVPAALPTTGSSSDRVIIIALFTLVFGVLFFRGRRISLI